MSRRFVILDRDGTICAERHYLSRPDQVELLPGAARGLRALRRLDLGLIVVTNQSGIGRGYFGEADLRAVHAQLRRLLAAEQIALDGVYCCPHLPEDECGCRKKESKPDDPVLVLEQSRNVSSEVDLFFQIQAQAPQPRP